MTTEDMDTQTPPNKDTTKEVALSSAVEEAATPDDTPAKDANGAGAEAEGDDADKEDADEKDQRDVILQAIEVIRIPREHREIELPEPVAEPLRKLASDRGLAMVRTRRYQLAFRLSDLRAYRQRKADNHTNDSGNLRREA